MKRNRSQECGDYTCQRIQVQTPRKQRQESHLNRKETYIAGPKNSHSRVAGTEPAQHQGIKKGINRGDMRGSAGSHGNEGISEGTGGQGASDTNGLSAGRHLKIV